MTNSAVVWWLLIVTAGALIGAGMYAALSLTGMFDDEERDDD